MEVITTHTSTDFDALASLVAASIIYPEAVVVLPRSLNPNVKAFLSIHKDLFDLETVLDIDLDWVTKLIVVDTNRWGRLDKMDALASKEGLVVHLWDHHPEIGDIVPHWSCQELTGAATTLLVQQLEEEKKELLSPIFATLFLAGIYEDTGNLSFPSTTAEDARAAAYLLDQQADLNVLNSFLRPTYGPKQKDILFEMLRSGNRTVIDEQRIGLSMVEVNGHTPGLSLVVQMYRDIVNVDAAFGIFVDPKKDSCMIIARSASDAINVATVLRGLGGGGHPAAASAFLKSANPEAVQDTILGLVRGNQQSSIQISDLMSFPVVTVPPDMTMTDVAQLLNDTGHSGVLVVEEGRLAGVISKRDFNRIKKKSGWRSPVKAFMSRDVLTIDPAVSPIKAARIMLKHDIGRLPVMEDGHIIGILTRSDLMIFFYDLLPD